MVYEGECRKAHPSRPQRKFQVLRGGLSRSIMNQNERNEKENSSLTESDFILRLVDIFRENDVICKVTGQNELTVIDEDTSFVVTITKKDR